MKAVFAAAWNVTEHKHISLFRQCRPSIRCCLTQTAAAPVPNRKLYNALAAAATSTGPLFSLAHSIRGVKPPSSSVRGGLEAGVSLGGARPSALCMRRPSRPLLAALGSRACQRVAQTCRARAPFRSLKNPSNKSFIPLSSDFQNKHISYSHRRSSWGLRPRLKL